MSVITLVIRREKSNKTTPLVIFDPDDFSEQPTIPAGLTKWRGEDDNLALDNKLSVIYSPLPDPPKEWEGRDYEGDEEVTLVSCHRVKLVG